MLRFGIDQWVDDIINAAQYLLKQQNCNIDGFQNTMLASKLQMEPKRVPFIQILNTSAMHWITISTIDVPLSTIRVYDSNHGQLYHRMHRSLLQISCNPTKRLLSFITCISMDTNSLIPMIVVCFQLRFAHTALCFDQDPSTMFFDVLISCFENWKMSLFPICGYRSPKPYTMNTIPIHCICRLIDEGTVILCFSCREWYQSGCISVPSKFNAVFAVKTTVISSYPINCDQIELCQPSKCVNCQ